jgi:integrase
VQTLWTWLAKRGIVKQWPTITRPPEADSLPKALTEEQLRRIFHSASRERGTIAGVPAAIWWRSFLAFIWNTSERKSAALAVRCEWLDLDRAVCTIPPDVRKGRRKWGVYELWPELVPLLKECISATPPRELVWPWERAQGSYYTAYNRILRDAGITPSRKVKTHGLRASHATWLKKAGGDPTQQLGHGDALTTAKYYLDPSICRTAQPKLFVPWQ